MNNKSRFLAVISALFLVIICIFLISPKLHSQANNLESDMIDEFELNQNIHSFRSSDLMKDNRTENTFISLNGLRINTNNKGLITTISITHDTAKSVKTNKGVTVGDTLENVRKFYGEDFHKRQEQGVEIIVYDDKNRYIEFWHWDNKVQEIRYGVATNAMP